MSTKFSFAGLVIETTENTYRYSDIPSGPGAAAYPDGCNYDVAVVPAGLTVADLEANHSHYSVLLDDMPGPFVESCGKPAVTIVNDDRYGQVGQLCAEHAIMSIGAMQAGEDDETIIAIHGVVSLTTV